MSSIHYKFRSLVSYKTINFETLHVSVEELKKAIFDAESLNPETFDLIIENSHTKREYSGKDIIPRNSSLIVKRVPRQDAAKLPKIQDTSTSGIISKAGPVSNDLGFMKTEEFSKLSEEQRLEHVKQVSYQKYQPSNYQKKAKYAMTDPPPPTYTCNRCNRTGHWVKNCPLATIRRTTGLPMDELVETTSDDPAAMLHPATGKYMIQKMHLKARLDSKAKAPIPFLRDSETKTASSEDENEKPKIQERPPPELICPICNELISEAVVMTCCGSSFCAECVQNLIVENPGRNCPGEGCTQTLSVDAMIRNVSLRKAVENYLKKQQGLNSRPNVASQSPSNVEKQVPSQKPLQPKSDPAPVIPTVDLSKPPPMRVNNPVVVLPDLSKPPPSFPVQTSQNASIIPQINTTTSNSLYVPETRKSVSPQKSASQSPNVESDSAPFEDQECATPPHVQTPPHVSTPPKVNPNLTLPPGAGEFQKNESPRHQELPKEAIQAFSAFNPASGIDLLANLKDDLAPPGVDDSPSFFQPMSTIDPVTGKLRGYKSHESKDRRSPISHRRRRRDSRSPVYRPKRRSPSPYRRPAPSRRERTRREKTPPRKKHESSKRRRNSTDHSRSEKRKKRRSRTKSQESAPEENDPIAEEEVAIDTVLKEITENLLPIKEAQISEEKSDQTKDSEKMEVDNGAKKSPKSHSKSPEPESEQSTRKPSTISTHSSDHQPAPVEDRGNQISIDIVDEEMVKEEDPMSKIIGKDESVSPIKEKVSRKHSSGEKKSKKSKKDKKHKDRKHRDKKHKDKKDRGGSKSKKKSKSKKEKSKKHRSRSDSSPRRRRSRS